MIAYVEGRVAQITENTCVVITGSGIGYEVYLAAHSLSQLPSQGEAVAFYTATVVREDALELFGFASWDERETFLLLITINRVGPRTAMAVLSVFRPDDLRRIVAEEDVQALTRVSGIGKKTAQQIFLELKYKLKGAASVVPGGGGKVPSSIVQDALAGLLNLGYAEEECLAVIKDALAAEPDLDVSEVLRASLKALAKGR